jgi:2-polyprenyl-3-methyl-5-hydroxy-6-metoxy-1,4-benzoquinol methylase
MWGISGEYCFAAEEMGATSVTGFDGMPPTQEFIDEHARRNSIIRFVQGDLNDPVSVEQIGEHDIVLCSGVIYHTPNPFLQLEHLGRICRETLILGSNTIPEVPGLEQACVFYPGQSAPQRAAFRSAYPGMSMPGVTEEFVRDPERAYENMWWGITPSALRAMTETAGFEVTDELRIPRSPFYTILVANRRRGYVPMPRPEANRLAAEAAIASGSIADFRESKPTSTGRPLN